MINSFSYIHHSNSQSICIGPCLEHLWFFLFLISVCLHVSNSLDILTQHVHVWDWANRNLLWDFFFFLSGYRRKKKNFFSFYWMKVFKELNSELLVQPNSQNKRLGWYGRERIKIKSLVPVIPMTTSFCHFFNLVNKIHIISMQLRNWEESF